MVAKTFRGGAADLTLANSLTSGTATIQGTGSASGWPDGSDGNAFVLQLEPDTDNAETVLCATLTTGTPSSIAVLNRGWDGTAAVAHSPGVTIRHVLDADTVNDVDGHVYDATRDNHSQYLNQARHDVTARHVFGLSGALGQPGAPADVATTASAGSGSSPAREDHAHVLGAASVTAAAIADGAIADPLNFGGGLAPVYFSDTDYATPTEGFLQWKPTRKRLQVWSVAANAWQVLSTLGCIATSSDTTGVNSGGGGHIVPGFSAAYDPDSLLASSHIVVPAYAAGWWHITGHVELNTTADTIATYGVQLIIVAGSTTTSGPAVPNNGAGHTTALSGSADVVLAAGDQIDVQIQHFASGARNLGPAHRMSAYYVGPS